MAIPTYHLSSYTAGVGWLFGQETRLVDRARPQVEKICLDETATVPGVLNISLDLPGSIRPAESGGLVNKVKALLKPKVAPVHSNAPIVIDMRYKSPQNWAHAFTNHLPLALAIGEQVSYPVDSVLLVFPDNMPSKSLEFFSGIGYQVLNTSAKITGNICRYEMTPWIGIRGERVEFVERGLKGSEYIRTISNPENGNNKIFISRKDRRKLENEAEIERFLEEIGYKKLYLEDFSLKEQITTLAYATDIIAVHGAALGPIILRPLLNKEPYHLCEIFSPAHITNVFRILAAQTGGSWVGVRGNIWPELLLKNANFDNNLRDFCVSLPALNSALESQLCFT